MFQVRCPRFNRTPIQERNQKTAMAKNRDNAASMLDAIDALIEKYHLLKHPFYKAWIEGTLSKESLQVYAEQYYQHVRAFPENLKQLADRADNSLSEIVEDNLAEELDPKAPHPTLWRQFAHSLGVNDAQIDSARPLPGIAALLDTYDEIVTQGSMAQAVAAFYVYEAQVPEIAAQKISGLRCFYDINQPEALAYFGVHEEADVRHRAAWREWLAEQKQDNSFDVLCAAERSLKALWGALDAVYPQGCVSKN